MPENYLVEDSLFLFDAMDAMDSLPLIILYEPRVLIRHGLCLQLQELGHQVIACLSPDQLTEEICNQSDAPKVLLVGAAGLEGVLGKILRTLHFTKTLSLKTVVYLPQKEELLTRLFIASGASYCLTEDELGSRLPLMINDVSLRTVRGKHFSLSELNVLLDYSSGLQTQEIATRRHCNYKTVFTFKRNARLRLDIDTKAGWMNLLSAMAQLSSYCK
ncbi:helix-turn-helix domain-containing protein [Lelliottia wanjuensis]|uniref:Uncharacterized protein n=1 Tax=Lelliottia wanjuensis TaxID=3050585 RepID=A0AAP4FRK6_9ENTR|nr:MULTISPECIES: hypothetical protein [unclassified Lelliottia]MDK9362718.1 hypothetical protein [Lelliottia sp. V106_12]MDK9615264.1 hypothetical protein [Lelliottia sp. V106_9]